MTSWHRGARIGVAMLFGFGFVFLGYWVWHRSPSQRFQVAWSAFLKDDIATVRNELEFFRQSPQQQPERRVLEAALLLRAKRYDDALNLLSKTQPQGEIRWALLQIVGESLYWKHQTADSERLFQTLAHERPEDARPHSWLGSLYYDMGHIGAARTELKRAIELTPTDPRPFPLLSMIESSSENYPLAIHYCQEALRLSPGVTNYGLLEELGDLMVKVQDFTAAAEVIQKVQPPTATSLALLGECEWNLGRKENAVRLVDSALKRSPIHVRAGLLKADWAIKSQKPQEAIDQLKRILKVFPYESPAWYQLARAYQVLGLRELAEDAMKSFEESQSLHQQFGKHQSEVRANPENIAAREQMVELALKLGKPDVAEFWQRAAIAWRNRVRSVTEPANQAQEDASNP